MQPDRKQHLPERTHLHSAQGNGDQKTATDWPAAHQLLQAFCQRLHSSMM